MQMKSVVILFITCLFIIPMLNDLCKAIEEEEKDYSLQIKVTISCPIRFQSVYPIDVIVDLTNLGNETFNGILTIEGTTEYGPWTPQEYPISNLTKEVIHSFLRIFRTDHEGTYWFIITIEEQNLSKIKLYQDSRLIDEGNRVQTEDSIFLHSFTEFIAIVAIIIGTIVTGVMGFLIHFLRLRRESPRLKTKVLKCEHGFGKKVETASFWVDFQMRNLGDRGTTIYDIDLTFKENGKEYHSEMAHSGKYAVTGQTGWISPHDTIKISKTAYVRYEGEKKEQIDCTFTIYHTHGSEKVKTVSRKREQ